MALQGEPHHFRGQLGRIAFLAQVGEDHPRQLGMHQLASQLGGGPVRQVTVATRDPALHRPWIGALPEHHVVVVRLQDEQVRALERVAHRYGWGAHVGGDADFQAAAALTDGDRHGVDGVVAGQERLDA